MLLAGNIPLDFLVLETFQLDTFIWKLMPVCLTITKYSADCRTALRKRLKSHHQLILHKILNNQTSDRSKKYGLVEAVHQFPKHVLGLGSGIVVPSHLCLKIGRGVGAHDLDVREWQWDDGALVTSIRYFEVSQNNYGYKSYSCQNFHSLMPSVHTRTFCDPQAVFQLLSYFRG